MRVWVDCTAAAHPLVLRPVIELLEADGHDVTVTARDYGQTTGVLDRLGMPYTAVGEHAGASRVRKLLALGSRSGRLARTARRDRFDLAIAHGSVDLALVAGALRIPAATMFDYEFASLQHHVGCRAARRVLTPDAIPSERLARFGAVGEKLAQFPGLKEEYYLADFEPDPAVLDELDVDSSRVLVVVRPPPAVSMYHHTNPLYGELIRMLAGREDVQTLVIPRTQQQGEEVQGLGSRSMIVPEREVDAQSLIALSDLVVSAGGTMNREAVALGTPVYSTFSGRLGGVDERLIAEGRLRPLTALGELKLVKRPDVTGDRVRRDPRLLLDLILGALR